MTYQELVDNVQEPLEETVYKDICGNAYGFEQGAWLFNALYRSYQELQPYDEEQMFELWAKLIQEHS